MAGQIVACPFCFRRFLLPSIEVLGAVAPPAELLLPLDSPVALPVASLTEQPMRHLTYQPRAEQEVIALPKVPLAAVVCMAACVVVAIAGAWFVRQAASMVRRSDPAAVQLADSARRKALPRLEEQGIQSLSDIRVGKSDQKVVLLATGRDEDGISHGVVVEWKVVDFGVEQRWQLESVSIDGQKKDISH
jgi:hypothetical protein